jgi:predicted site-specific integrase-resolvase|tara:strand:- start:1348 stop:1662 length:315 start_codon:yes stop_codon:yes gene_type:complete
VAAQINEGTKLTLDLKTIGLVIAFTVSLAATYFTITSTVAKNTEDIESINTNSVNSVEFQYKDELVRSTIQRVEEKQEIMGEDIKEVKTQLDKIDQRLYELSKR